MNMNGLRFYTRNTSAMTLMELLVATALVGIVLVSTLSVDYTIHSMRKTTGDSATVAMATSATMIELTSNIQKAVGDAQDLGIVLDSSVPPKWFCARQDTDNNPEDYTNDNWTCYWKPTGSSDPNIYTCTKNVSLGQTPGACTTTDRIVGTAACGGSWPTVDCSTYLLTFSLTNSPSTNEFYFDIALTNRSNPTSLVDPNAPLKNPQYSLNSRIAPLGHSY